MKKIFLAGVIMFMTGRSMALSFYYSIYAVSVASLKTAINAPGGTNYVAIMNGNTNLLVAPATYNGSGTPTITNTSTGNYFSAYSSKCPIYCDIQSLASELASAQNQPSTYSANSTDLTNFYTANSNSYNCLLLNKNDVSTYIGSSSTVATVFIFVWATGAGTNLYSYVGVDANNRTLSGFQFSDNSALAFRIQP